MINGNSNKQVDTVVLDDLTPEIGKINILKVIMNANIIKTDIYKYSVHGAII